MLGLRVLWLTDLASARSRNPSPLKVEDPKPVIDSIECPSRENTVNIGKDYIIHYPEVSPISIGRERSLDGVFLCAQAHVLRNRVEGRRCDRIGVPVPDSIGFVFGDDMLVLSAKPGSPSIWWTGAGIMTDPASPAWIHHLEGCTVRSVTQPGSDRILHVQFSSGLLYGAGDVRVIFEGAGRNSNIILLRGNDNRILACLRKIPNSKCRFRTIAPGTLYVPPPSSGLHPGEWRSSESLRAALAGDDIDPAAIYHLLEGIGPPTAAALIRHASENHNTVLDAVLLLEDALLNSDFHPWMSPEGPMPIPLGQGKPIEDPLSADISGSSIGIRADRAQIWKSLLDRKLASLHRKLVGQERALENLVDPDTCRTWGNMLLSSKHRSRRGMRTVRLTDWNGIEHEIPLKISRTLTENAQRYFRKATNSSIERENLEAHIAASEREITEIEDSLDEAGTLSIIQIDSLLLQHRRSGYGKKKGGERTPLILKAGWRCFVGRNARDNDEITFRIGKRGDLWFHARGMPGAHVVLKRDGRVDNPPEEVILEAAVAAARGSRVSSGVVPVDYTGVQYVNRMKKGKPGQVVYTREKTIFVDLDKLPVRIRSVYSKR